ncbi:MAG TPA: bifunctional UDP-sugar hydrolase/5'-nucleotidase [Candidatus Wallbacteria bacterium]|nr:MAG: Trifunctional nucleotide phosphoesterase protein YfkN precursor [bacterium ADurb.Bin243]HPG58833.1 bifunctional UDP-sugar hydrolase/5'-nucleotidase [Candidatus Wallbacteria bacterium]
MKNNSISKKDLRKNRGGIYSIFFILAVILSSVSCVFDDGAQIVSGPYKNLSIYHINDAHSHLTQAKDGATKKYYGGASRLKTLLNKTRSSESIVLAAGDLVQGTLFYNFFHGAADIETFNAVGLDAFCLGNHEFDGGVDSLFNYYSKSSFPVLAANINFKTNPSAAALVKPYTIIEKNGLKIAVIGIDTPQITSDNPKLLNDITISEPALILKQYAVELRSGVDLIIALTHIGYNEDLKLASEIEEVDIIIGGHSHTEVPVPAAVKNKGGICMVAQTGAYLKYLGNLNLKVCPKDLRLAGTPRYIYESGGLDYIGEDITPDPLVESIVSVYEKQIGENVKVKFASTANVLNGNMADNRKSETNLANLFADAIKNLTNADIALINGGNFRESITGPDITYENIYTAAPYDNPVVTIELSGAELIEDFKMTASRYDGDWGGFLQFSKGMKVIYENHAFISAALDGVAIDGARTYKVAMSEYIASGGDGHSIFASKKQDAGAIIKISDAVIGYIKSLPQPIDYRAEGRIVINDPVSNAFKTLLIPYMPPRR